MDHLPITDGGQVPVFDCHVILAPRDAAGTIRGRCANLPGIEATAATERGVLMEITRRFKAEVGRLHAAREPIPFATTPETPAAGEVERWLPVHL
jgi:hypothetical protein